MKLLNNLHRGQKGYYIHKKTRIKHLAQKLKR